MTSKQALSKLKHDKKYNDEVINAIEKDLEVLEIFRNNRIDIDQLALFLSIKGDDKSVYELYKEVTPFVRITFKEFVLLKEWWLANDK